MEERVDDTLKDVEREIDHAIDQLFFGESSEMPPAEPTAILPEKESAEPASENEDGTGGFADQAEGDKVAEKVAEKELVSPAKPYLEIMESLQRKVRAMSEWGVTEAAIDKIITGMDEIHGAFHQDPQVREVVEMVAEILTRLKENPESQNGDLVNFLLDAFGFIKELIETKKELRGVREKEIFERIHERYVNLSKKIVSDEGSSKRKSLDSQDVGREERPSWLEQTALREEIPPRETPGTDIHATVPERSEAGKEDIINLDLELLEPEFPKPAQTQEKSVEGATSALSQELPDRAEQHAKAAEKMGEGEIGEQKGPLQKVPVDGLHTVTEMLSETLYAVKKALWETKGIRNLTEILAIEIVEMNKICERVAKKAMDSAVRSDAERLIRALKKTQMEFVQLSNLLDPVSSQGVEMEAVIPVAVGKKVVALRERFVDAIYSITREQEKRFREKGTISLKGERLPFVDLMEEFHEVSSHSDRHLVIVMAKEGKRALLVDKILKRRVAVLARSDSPETPRNARIYIEEEMPMFE